MTAEAGQEPGAPKARRWWRLVRVPRRGRMPFALAFALLLALIVLWNQRRPIAANFIDNQLAARDVPASYRVADIGVSSQRIEDVVIGDPADPDLVADWVVVNTDIGLSGASVTGIEAGQVRVRSRLVEGRLALGYLDRLLPPPSGAPFALPDLFVAVVDARMRLETPHGLVGVKLAGRGRLDDGFAGRIGLASERLAVAGCLATGVGGAMDVTIAKGAPTLEGPLTARTIACGGEARAERVGLDLSASFGATLDRWRGRSAVSAASLAASDAVLGGVGGSVTFDGSAARTGGRVDLSARRFRHPIVQGMMLSAEGQYRIEPGNIRLAGQVGAGRATLPDTATAGVTALARTAANTPLADIATRLAAAVRVAGRDMAVDADVAAQVRGDAGAIVVRELSLAAASSARVRIADGQGIRYGWPGARLRIDGTLTVAGGGLPDASVRINQAMPGDAIRGRAVMRPYLAGNSVLALSPVRFEAAADGATRIAARVTLSGPLPGGRVDALTLPIDARWDGRDRLIVNPGCVPAGFDRLQVSALTLRSARLTLCPEGSAMLNVAAGGVNGGFVVAQPRLSGRIGGTPLRLAASRARFGLGDLTVGVSDLAARLGDPDRLSRLDIAALDGRISGGGVGGRFAGADGAIGNVPILLSGGAGDWRFENGRLTLDGETLRVADDHPQPRYNPLAADDFRLTLEGSRIDATGTLVAPGTAVRVADVTIRHDLGEGAGRADLVVPGITFTEAFQPELLTRLTFGVIADVAGTVSGRGQIRWNRDGVTSDGVFRTTDTDLAAAFGPVEGIAGQVRFIDLLGLESAPGQVATIATVNPGIPVEDGRVRYQLLPDQRVQVEGGRWPLAGGELLLEPTILDFGKDVERRMVFRVQGIDAAQFLQQFEFDNLNATGTFDGVLPMIFDQRGGRIEDGRLTVREGGGNIAYVGEITREDVGIWGNLAFEALRSLDYERLNITMNGPLSGEMVTAIRFAGVSQGEGAKRNFIIDRLARLPFVFNVTVRAPFRQLIDSVQSYYDPSRLIERNLPALIEEQQRRTDQPPDPGVQPPASEKLP